MRAWLCSVVVVGGIAGFGAGCSKKERQAEPGAEPARPPARVPTPESAARKTRSETRLRAEGVPLAATLPVIETAAEAKPRTQDAVVDRTLALLLVALKAEGLEAAKITEARDHYQAAPFFSPDEQAFIAAAAPDQAARTQFIWRYEGLAVMLWALGFDATLPSPAAATDAGRLVKVVMSRSPSTFRGEARLRPVAELLDEADAIYRYDWACVDARGNGQKLAMIDCDVVVERHHALNWLIGYLGQAWDDVSTDT